MKMFRYRINVSPDETPVIVDKDTIVLDYRVLFKLSTSSHYFLSSCSLQSTFVARNSFAPSKYPLYFPHGGNNRNAPTVGDKADPPSETLLTTDGSRMDGPVGD